MQADEPSTFINSSPLWEDNALPDDDSIIPHTPKMDPTPDLGDTLPWIPKNHDPYAILGIPTLGVKTLS